MVEMVVEMGGQTAAEKGLAGTTAVGGQEVVQALAAEGAETVQALAAEGAPARAALRLQGTRSAAAEQE
jgi:hypothetical protein